MLAVTVIGGVNMPQRVEIHRESLKNSFEYEQPQARWLCHELEYEVTPGESVGERSRPGVEIIIRAVAYHDAQEGLG